MLAQWCQPTICVTENAITDQLDAIAEQVRTMLKSRHPDHPATEAARVFNKGRPKYQKRVLQFL